MTVIGIDVTEITHLSPSRGACPTEHCSEAPTPETLAAKHNAFDAFTLDPLQSNRVGSIVHGIRLEKVLVIRLAGVLPSKEEWQQSIKLIAEASSTQSVVPSRSKQSAESLPDTCSYGLLAMYEAVDRTLTLFEVHDTRRWMRNFNDTTSIAALSIPGTHNTPTCHRALPSVRCQATTPITQLSHGVRFFDVRVQLRSPQDPNDETLYLVHGAVPIALTGHKKLRDLVHHIEAFLQQNPSETLILCLKREGIGKGTDTQLADLLYKHYAANWYTEARIPCLGEVRGKVVLMRRFALSEALQASHGAWGLDAECWPDNTPSAVHGNVDVQDFYRITTPSLIPAKLEWVCAQMKRASEIFYAIPAAGPSAPESQAHHADQVFLNFLSASNFGDIRCWPRRIAHKLNPAVRRYLCVEHARLVCAEHKPTQARVGDGSLGIVVCDWVGASDNWDIVNCVIGMNCVRLHKEHGLNSR